MDMTKALKLPLCRTTPTDHLPECTSETIAAHAGLRARAQLPARLCLSLKKHIHSFHVHCSPSPAARRASCRATIPALVPSSLIPRCQRALLTFQLATRIGRKCR